MWGHCKICKLGHCWYVAHTSHIYCLAVTLARPSWWRRPIIDWCRVSIQVGHFHFLSGCFSTLSALYDIQDPCLPHSHILMKELLGYKSTNGLKTCPSQSRMHSYILICIFTSQSDPFLTNQDSAIWTNQIMWIWRPYLHRNRPIRDVSGTVLYLNQLHLGFKGHFCNFHLRLHFTQSCRSWNYLLGIGALGTLP